MGWGRFREGLRIIVFIVFIVSFEGVESWAMDFMDGTEASRQGGWACFMVLGWGNGGGHRWKGGPRGPVLKPRFCGRVVGCGEVEGRLVF